MNKFFAWLIGTEDKPCKTCVALQEQIEYERAVNKEMLETLTSLLKPVPIIQQQSQAPRTAGPQGVLWSRRRAELEKQDRERMKVQVNSPVVGKPDSEMPKIEERKTIDQLELELGVAIEATEGS